LDCFPARYAAHELKSGNPFLRPAGTGRSDRPHNNFKIKVPRCHRASQLYISRLENSVAGISAQGKVRTRE